MSSGEADAIRVRPPEPPPVPILSRPAYPPFSMGRFGFRSALKFEDWQLRTRGVVMRCGFCKNLIEEEWGPGGMQMYRHVTGTTSRCREILPYKSTR